MNLNPITFLIDNVENLWYMTYGLIAGWGLSYSLLVGALIVVIIRLIRCERKVFVLEQRLVHAERDYNLTLSKWNK
jgi:hypothetical protein